MASKQQAMKVAAKYGARIDSDSDMGLASAWLPDDKAWQESGGRVVMVNYGYWGQMQDVWSDLIELMEGGLVV